ncbi:MAG: sigma-70 region 4 domain-containing protein [Clostridia bacterium]|nr:sigma-70 region 4 domain-containing protein [Clostridia bacterium]
MDIADAVKAIAAQNPKFAQAIVLKEYYGLSVADIAQKLNDTKRNIYYYLDQAKKIGKQYKRDNE